MLGAEEVIPLGDLHWCTINSDLPSIWAKFLEIFLPTGTRLQLQFSSSDDFKIHLWTVGFDALRKENEGFSIFIRNLPMQEFIVSRERIDEFRRIRCRNEVEY